MEWVAAVEAPLVLWPLRPCHDMIPVNRSFSGERVSKWWSITCTTVRLTILSTMLPRSAGAV